MNTRYEFRLRGRGDHRDIAVTQIIRNFSGNIYRRKWVIPYEVWSGPLWALLCEELDKQGQRRRK